MDVSSCNPLFDLRFDTRVLSMTLNCSTEITFQRDFRGRLNDGLFFRHPPRYPKAPLMIPCSGEVMTEAARVREAVEKGRRAFKRLVAGRN